MKQRWLRIGLLAGIVFALNVIGRLVVRLGSIEDVETQDRVSLFTLIAIAVAMATTAVVWGRQRPQGDVVGELAGAAVAGGVLSLFVGPFASDSTPVADGLNVFLAEAGIYAGFAGGGALVGLLLLIMLGKDYKSRSLARYAEEKLAKPRRPVRR